MGKGLKIKEIWEDGLDLRKLKIQIKNNEMTKSYKDLFSITSFKYNFSEYIAHHSIEVIDPKVLCVTERY